MYNNNISNKRFYCHELIHHVFKEPVDSSHSLTMVNWEEVIS